jgi:hypothetical protein
MGLVKTTQKESCLLLDLANISFLKQKNKLVLAQDDLGG